MLSLFTNSETTIEDDTQRIIKRQRTIPRIKTREARGCPRHDDLHSNAEPDLEQQSRSRMDLSLHHMSSKTSREEENTRSQKRSRVIAKDAIARLEERMMVGSDGANARKSKVLILRPTKMRRLH